MKELYIVADVEGSGGPYNGNMVSLGAVVAEDPTKTFYIEFKPEIGRVWEKAAEAIHGLSWKHLTTTGVMPLEGMVRFVSWVHDVAAGRRPVLVTFGTYDWMFIGAYLATYSPGGYTDPFGPNTIDMKSYFMGWRNTDWRGTAKSRMPERLKSSKKHTHNALDDALEQAEMWQLWLAERNQTWDRKN